MEKKFENFLKQLGDSEGELILPKRLVYAMFCETQWSKIWESEVQRVNRICCVVRGLFFWRETEEK